MKINAAVTQGKGEDFKIKEIELQKPKANEVLVEIHASGICHTDGVARDMETPPLPSVLGHEGGGVVKEVGKDVTYVEPGDHVIMSFLACGECESCLTGHPGTCENHMKLNFAGTALDGTHRHKQDDQDVSMFFGQSSFATYSVANEQNIVKVSKDIDLGTLAPLGCGIQTGAGTVLNRLKPEFGSNVVVFGMGGVGLSAIMAAKITGSNQVVGVDLHDSRLDLAKEVGATSTINSKNTDNLVDEIRNIIKDGPDYIIDTTGVSFLIEEGIKALKHGGTMAVISAKFDFSVQNHLMEGNKSIVGFTQGDSNPKLFIPELINYYKHGQFPFDKLITKYDFENINEAFKASESGETIKPVLTMK